MTVLVIAEHDNVELKDPTLNTVTAAAEIDVQTDGAGGGLYTGARRSSSPWGVAARPLAAKPGASYFERLFAKNVERMAGKKVSDGMRVK